MAEDLLLELGGMPCLEKVHTIFYDKLLKHPWLKEFFKGVPRSHFGITAERVHVGRFRRCQDLWGPAT